MSEAGGLTPKQQLFVTKYLDGGNATAAYREAYPAVQTDEAAASAASRLLGNVKVAAAVKAASENAGAATARVVEEMSAVALSDIGDILDFTGERPQLRPAHQISERARRSISSVKVKRAVEKTGDGFREVEIIEFKLWDKNSAADKLLRVQGAYKDKLEVNSTGTLQVDWKQLAVRDEPLDPVAERIGREVGRNGHHANGEG